MRTSAIATLLLAAPLIAQPLPLDQLIFERLPNRVRLPTDLVDPGDGTGRLFVLSQPGRVLALDPEEDFPVTMLNIEEQVSCCGERGLLGIALHPDFQDNGLFFLSYTNREGEHGHNILARYRMSDDDPGRADPASERILLDIEMPTVGHMAGQIAFGIDGYLYVSRGDGGLSQEFPDAGQDLGTLLGKILRIDIDGGDPYAIPPTNPFIGAPGARQEIYQLGLRNPWRFSFDRETADMFIGDVGDGEWEEISFQSGLSGGGENYGWRFFEGSQCWKNSNFCDPTGLTPPIIEYPHGEPNGCGYSVTGGIRYRGFEMPAFRGAYFFGEYCTGELWAATENGGVWEIGEPLETGWNISTLAEGAAGELYIANYAASEFYRITTQRPQPVLSGVTPRTVAAGTSGAAVAISGKLFHPESVVTFGGVEVETEFVDDRMLLARPVDAIFARPGETRAAVMTPGPGGGASDEALVAITVASGPPSVADGGVVNAASFASGPIAPGTIVSIFGAGVAVATEAAGFLPLPTALGGATVLLNEAEPAELFAATAGQLNLLFPHSLAGARSVTVSVRVGAGVETFDVPLTEFSPGVFTVDSSGAGQAAATIGGTRGCLAAPADTAPCARPARRGESIEIFATGLGALVPASAAARLQRPTVTAEPARVSVGGSPAAVAYSGAAPGFGGLYQVNVTIDARSPSGEAVPLELNIGGVQANLVTIAVAP